MAGERTNPDRLRIRHVLNHTYRLNGHVHAAVDLACAQARLGKPLITTVHNAFERSAVAMGVGRRVIAASAAVGRSMADRGIPARRLRVVLNGTIGSARLDPQPPPPSPPFGMSMIDAARNGGNDEPAAVPCPTALKLLFIGGLHPRKGVSDLLDAFVRVHATRPDTRLTIVGEGPHSDEYKQRVAHMAGASAVTFSSGQSDSRPFFAAADIFILPSLADPARLVLSEARAAGCAVVATAVDGIPELLKNGRAGILVPPSDPTQLGDAILALVRDLDELALWKRNSQYNIDHLSIARVAQETIAAYSECPQPGHRQSHPNFSAGYWVFLVDGSRRS